MQDRDNSTRGADGFVNRLVFLVCESLVALEADLALLRIGLAREHRAELVLEHVGRLDRLVVLMGGDDMTFQRNVDIMYAIQKAGGILVISE